MINKVTSSTPISFSGNQQNKEQNSMKKILTCSAVGAVVIPLVDAIDGEGFRHLLKAYNIPRLVTSGALLGGLWGISEVYGDKFTKTGTEQQQKNKRLQVDMIKGAILAPIGIKVVEWSSSKKASKPIKAKWYALIALAGAMLMPFMSDRVRKIK